VSLVLVAFPTTAAPKADLWQRWTAHDPGATATIDHSPWDRFLKTYVSAFPDGVNRVAYARVSDAGRERLDRYIDVLTAVPISVYSRDEQRAYWINLYNALTVQVVLNHYPVKSIRRIKPNLFSIGPWRKKLITVEGEQLSLDDIEHRILRPIWRDPRLHYAVNCAAIGCPNLQTEAYTASNTDALLDRGAQKYVNNARGAAFRNGRLIVSSIYEWFQEDFGNSDQGVIQHLQRYAEPALASRLNGAKRISGDRYDWTLNDAARASR
jgi:hypothetical protein